MSNQQQQQQNELTGRGRGGSYHNGEIEVLKKTNENSNNNIIINSNDANRPKMLDLLLSLNDDNNDDDDVDSWQSEFVLVSSTQQRVAELLDTVKVYDINHVADDDDDDIVTVVTKPIYDSTKLLKNDDKNNDNNNYSFAKKFQNYSLVILLLLLLVLIYYYYLSKKKQSRNQSTTKINDFATMSSPNQRKDQSNQNNFVSQSCQYKEEFTVMEQKLSPFECNDDGGQPPSLIPESVGSSYEEPIVSRYHSEFSSIHCATKTISNSPPRHQQLGTTTKTTTSSSSSSSATTINQTLLTKDTSTSIMQRNHRFQNSIISCQDNTNNNNNNSHELQQTIQDAQKVVQDAQVLREVLQQSDASLAGSCNDISSSSAAAAAALSSSSIALQWALKRQESLQVMEMSRRQESQRLIWDGLQKQQDRELSQRQHEAMLHAMSNCNATQKIQRTESMRVKCWNASCRLTVEGVILHQVFQIIIIPLIQHHHQQQEKFDNESLFTIVQQVLQMACLCTNSVDSVSTLSAMSYSTTLSNFILSSAGLEFTSMLDSGICYSTCVINYILGGSILFVIHQGLKAFAFPSICHNILNLGLTFIGALQLGIIQIHYQLYFLLCTSTIGCLFWTEIKYHHQQQEQIMTINSSFPSSTENYYYYPLEQLYSILSVIRLSQVVILLAMAIMSNTTN